MPLIKIPFEGGINKQITKTSAQYRWTDCDFVRFRYGSPEKIGGWQQTTSDTLTGVARAMHIWADLSGNRYVAIGTHRLLVIYYEGAFYDITPLATALTSCTITTTNGSATATINKAAHGLETGDIIVISSVTLPGSGTGFSVSDFEKTFEVITVPNADSFTITMASNESGGGITTAGSLTATPYEKVGSNEELVGYGFGTGFFGGEVLGAPFTTLNGALLNDANGTGGSGTTIALTSASSFTSSGRILVENELITYTSISTNDLQSIGRGAQGTSRAAHSDGTTVTDASNFVGFGNATDSSNVTLEPGSWSLDNFGQILLATIKNGKTFEWDPSQTNALTTRAVVSSGNPTKSVESLVSERDRHVIHIGTETTIGSAATQDPMFIRFSNQGDRTTYTPKSTNTAGTFRLDSGTKIKAAVKGKDYILIATDTSAYRMQFVGPPFTFSITQVGSNCGAISQHSMVFIDGATYWMGEAGGFFRYDGTVKKIPCSVEDFVFSNVDDDDLGLNFGAGNMVYAHYNSLFTEINWFYPKAGSQQIDRCVSYNYRENIWTISSLDRTTFYDKTVYDTPYATQYSTTSIPTFPVIQGATASNGASTFYAHEVGVNQVDSLGNKTAIPAFIESGDFELELEGNGEFFVKVRRFLPDFKFIQGDSKVTINIKDFPSDTEKSSLLGPFTVSSSTKKIDTRVRGRFAALRVENDTVDQNWRFGSFRADVQPDGRR